MKDEAAIETRFEQFVAAVNRFKELELRLRLLLAITAHGVTKERAA